MKRPTPEPDPQITAVLKSRVLRLSLAWFPDRPVINAAHLLIGVGAWSIYDARLLVCVSEAVASGVRSDLHVSIFDVDELPFSRSLQRLFPGTNEVFQPPLVGYWDAGQLKEIISGFEGCQFVGEMLGFDPQSIIENSAQTAG